MRNFIISTLVSNSAEKEKMAEFEMVSKTQKESVLVEKIKLELDIKRDSVQDVITPHPREPFSTITEAPLNDIISDDYCMESSALVKSSTMKQDVCNIQGVSKRKADLLARFKERTMVTINSRVTLVKKKTNENTELFVATDNTVDPLLWKGTMGWRWYTSFVAFVTFWLFQSVVLLVSLNIIGMRDTLAEDKYSWWKCGIYCTMITFFFHQCFSFVVLRAIIKSNPVHTDLAMGWSKFIQIVLCVDFLGFLIWSLLYYVNEGFVYFHGICVGLVGLLADALMVWVFCPRGPRGFSTDEFRKTFILILGKSSVIFCAQALCYLTAGIAYNLSGKFPAMVLIYSLIRNVFDYLADWLCVYCGYPALRIIFYNTNGMFQRLFIIWVLGATSGWASVCLVGFIGTLQTLIYTFMMIGPLSMYVDWKIIPKSLYLWMIGRVAEDTSERNLTHMQVTFATSERSKWLYVACLALVGEFIIPMWSLINYHLCMATKATRNTIVGYARADFGIDLITSESLLRTTWTLGIFDVVDMLIFTFIVRRKFKQFTPFRILNVLVMKFGLILGWSIVTVVVIMICMYIIDCNFDYVGFGRFLASL